MSKGEGIALLVAGLAAFAALLSALVTLYAAWLDSRWLRIRVEPFRVICRPIDDSRTFFELDFLVRLSAFNPARMRNTILSEKVKGWRDKREVPCSLAAFAPTTDPFPHAVVIEPFEEVSGEVFIRAFDKVPEPRQAYDAVSRIWIKVKPERGRGKTVCIERARFPFP